VLEGWDEIEAALRARVDTELQVNSGKIRNTLARYKELMERAIVQQEISKLAWNSSNILSYKQPTECNMDCYNFCFTEELYRFENINSVYEVCLVARCNCTTGDVAYDVTQSG
jgi:hypothetical protein